MTHTVKRKLTTIFCADVVGYSKLMGADEHGTLVRLKQCRELIEAFIQRHHGRVVSWSGDAVLADFSSVVESVQCAVEIQRELKAQNETIDASQKMAFRIGVNLGDVMIDDHDIFGEGVNIASRLQGLAPPGGILISGSVHDQIKNKLALGYNFLGNQQVKNIADQVPTFVVLHETAPSLPIAGDGRQRKGGAARAVTLAPAPISLRIAAGAVDGAFACLVAFALAVGLQGAVGPVFVIDAPFTFFATERMISSDLPSTDIEGGGKIIRTTTRSVIERNYFGLVSQTYKRSDVEVGPADASKRPSAIESHEALIDGQSKGELLRLPLTAASVLFYFVLLVAAEGLFMKGASPGKILMGIRVSPVQSDEMDLNRAALRNLLKIVSVGSAFAGVLMALFSKRRQMLHDLLTGSYVHDAK
ncbi:MAG: RDD family protein [Micropepsaceae bacterium]